MPHFRRACATRAKRRDTRPICVRCTAATNRKTHTNTLEGRRSNNIGAPRSLQSSIMLDPDIRWPPPEDTNELDDDNDRFDGDDERDGA